MHASTRPRPCIHTHPPMHARTHKHVLTRARAHTQKYVILIDFPQQQWFRERESILRYTYIACLVSHNEGTFYRDKTTLLREFSVLLTLEGSPSQLTV